MNLRLRITCGFLLIVLIMSIVSGIIVWKQIVMKRAFDTMYETVELENL